MYACNVCLANLFRKITKRNIKAQLEYAVILCHDSYPIKSHNALKLRMDIQLKTNCTVKDLIIYRSFTYLPSPWIEGSRVRIQEWIVVYLSCVNINSPTFWNDIP
jgi:hypothetical protein